MTSQPVKFNKEMIEMSLYSKFQDFHNLMRHHVRDILLVSSLYDSYIFEEDNRLYELIRQEYQGLNLSHSPEIVNVTNGEEAIRLATQEKKFDLIITTLHIEDMSALTFASKVRESGLDIPVILLSFDNREMTNLISTKDISLFDKVFMWQGDYRIVLGIIKFLEDRLNVAHDTQHVGVQCIIIIEDNIRFYSSYLPLIYTEVLKQSQSLISEGINLSHKFLRMRARPKILLCSSFEEGWEYFEKYEEHILGIISDVDFTRDGKRDPQAGILFAKKVKEREQDIPILLQSTNRNNRELAQAIGAAFLEKNSPTLLEELKEFMMHNFGFGDFVFRNNEGIEVGRAQNLTELEVQLEIVPAESIVFHASRNHFSNWLKARTEFWLAHQLRPKKVEDFPSTESLRRLLIDYVREFRKSRQIGVISDFNKNTFDASTTFARIGAGSMGGKARGLGFVNKLMSNFDLRNRFNDVKIFVPPAVVLAVDLFDQFLDDNDLREFALKSDNDKTLMRRFFRADNFPRFMIDDLRSFLELVREPLAVRSSSLLEDSQGQPFAGVYDTFMIPNCHPDLEVRMKQLFHTIKRIYSSVFTKRSKDYFKVTSYRLEEEKMAVIIQKLVGSNHDGRFYPEFSGVAKSFNFYPSPPLKSTDGTAAVAPGFGKIIVEGGSSFRFSPRYPTHPLQLGNLEDLLKYTPNDFFALDLNEKYSDKNIDEEKLVKKYPLFEAEKDGALDFTCSTYSIENQTLNDGLRGDGPRVFTLSPIIKQKVFPLPEILELLLEMGTWGTGSPVELEFAVNLNVETGKPKEFGLLQIRPLVIHSEIEELDLDNINSADLICQSNQVLGHGLLSGIKDIICVDIEKFDRKFTVEIAHEIAQFNSKLVSTETPYLLIGVGRWGTFDPWLGIPVTWEQINGARAIIESNFPEFNVTPSQGSHFFQNLTSFKVGYFTIDDFTQQGFIDWKWLSEQNIIEQKKFTRHIKFSESVTVKMNGHSNSGIIVKPS